MILLDLHGKMMDSETFAKKLDGWQGQSSNLVFVIAGSLGPSEKLVERANFSLEIIGLYVYAFDDARFNFRADLSWLYD